MKRKFIALTLAALMLLTAAPVFAATYVPSTTLPVDQVITGAGGVLYLNTTIYLVVLPTNASLNFTLDPQGLAAIAGGDSAQLEDLDGGRIISYAPAKIVNYSSTPVKVTAKLKGLAAGTPAATFIPYTTDTATTIANVAAAGNNVLIYAAFSKVNIADPAAAFQRTEKGYVLTGTEQTFEFEFDAAEYTVTNNNGTYTAAAEPGTGHGSAISLGGHVNKDADWSAFTGANPAATVKVEATFTFEDFSDGTPGTAVTDIPGLVDNTTVALTLASPGFGTSGSTVTDLAAAITATQAGTADITTPFFTDGLVAAGLYVEVDGADYPLSSAEYSITGGQITIKRGDATYAFNPANCVADDWSMKLVLSDTSEYTFTIEIT
jgi:hypothetical protein